MLPVAMLLSGGTSGVLGGTVLCRVGRHTSVPAPSPARGGGSATYARKTSPSVLAGGRHLLLLRTVALLGPSEP